MIIPFSDVFSYGTLMSSTCCSGLSSPSSWRCTGRRRLSCFGDFPQRIPLGVLVDIAGWLELIAAFLIAFGVFTRLGAGALVVAAVSAYFVVHAGNGVWPHIYPADGGPGANGGEVTILWFAIAGIIGVLGSRKYGIERLWLKREIL